MPGEGSRPSLPARVGDSRRPAAAEARSRVRADAVVASSLAREQVSASSRARRLRLSAAVSRRRVRRRGVVLPAASASLTDKDTIVLADFTNTTGDPVFDETLRQGLAVQLEQSPFLSIVPDERIRRALQLMGQPPDARLTDDVARDLCVRTGSTAVVDGIDREPRHAVRARSRAPRTARPAISSTRSSSRRRGKKTC